MNSRQLACGVFTIALVLWAPTCVAQTKTLWSIFWLSDKLPCEGYWTKPMTAVSVQCPLVAGVKVSICPRPKDLPYYPYDQGKPITVVGYQIAQILSSPTSNGYMVLGSNHSSDGADIFALTAGVGSNSKSGLLPPGTGLSQGDPKSHPDAHFDVYGVCDSGTQQALVNILYTSP